MSIFKRTTTKGMRNAGTAKEAGANEAASSSLSTARASAEPAVDAPMMRLQTDLFKLGRDRAVDSGALKAREADLEALTENAEAMARETRRDAYDPINKPEHAIREAEHQKCLADRAETEDAAKFSAASVRERERELARLPISERPKASAALMCGVLIGIAATIAPTIHDFFFSAVEDAVLAWVFSLISAGFLASVIVWAILGSIGATGRRTAANWAGLAAGITISVGLALFRLAGATQTEEVVAALGLTLLEIGLVVLAEWVAVGLREHFREWVVRQAAHDEAFQGLRAAQSDHERRQASIQKLNSQISEHIRFIEDLALRNGNLPELIRQAVKAVVDGYNDGIAFNRGHVRRAGGSK